MMADPNLVFTAEHLKALKEFLWPAQTQYKNIYIALGFNVSDLQASANQVRDLYTEVITAVVNKGTTKQELVAALRSRPVGYGQLAQKLHDDTNIEDGVLKDAAKIIALLQPATARCRALALQLDVDPDEYVPTSQQDPFHNMLKLLVNDKCVTQKQLADALHSPLVGYGQLGNKFLQHDFGGVKATSKASLTITPPGQSGKTVEAATATNAGPSTVPSSDSQGGIAKVEGMKLTKYLEELGKKGINSYVIIVKEALEACLGDKSLKQKDIDEAMEVVELDFSEAVVTSESKKRDTKELHVKKDYENDTREVKKEKHQIDLKCINSTEFWKENTSGWSVSGTLGAEYQGAKASTTAGYHRGTTEKSVKKDAFEVTMPFSKEFTIQPNSSCAVTVVEEEEMYTVSIRGLLLEFSRDAKPKLKINCLQKRKLSKIFEESGKIKSDKDGKITAEIDGKLEAINVKRYVAVYPSS